MYFMFQLIIETRNRSIVNMSGGNLKLDKLPRNPKNRPASAPATKHEETLAYRSASETDDYVNVNNDKNRPGSCKPRILEAIKCEIEEGKLPDKNERSAEETEKLIDKMRRDILGDQA